MKTVSHMRRFCALALAVSLLFAGVGAGLAVADGVPGLQDHAAMGHNGHTPDPVGKSQVPHGQTGCPHLSSAAQDATAPAHHGDQGGCCHSPTSPPAASLDAPGVGAISATVERLALPADRLAVSAHSDKQFRPPRPFV